MQRRRRLRTGVALVAASGVLAAAAASTTAAAAPAAPPPIDPAVLDPIDPQNWVNMDDMTWDDYVPVPGTDWADDTEGSTRQFNGAIVLLDFENQPFLVTEEEGAHPFGDPSSIANGLDREDVPQFYLDLLNTPNELNHGRTINEYWMEQSGGRLSVQMEAFGPYKLPGNIEEYGLNDSFNKDPGAAGNSAYCPQGLSCNKNIRTDALSLWGADMGVPDPLREFDQVFYITAGHDESSTWEEFGQMLFENPEDVTDDFGPPRDENGVALDQNGQPMKNWAKTRYIPWTSWQAAINHWPNANFASGGRAGNSTQAESSGMGTFAHEFSHILGISDNYGNPYGTEGADGGPLRDTSGPFDVLARGSFNGPGGTHQRWSVPSIAGGSQPAGVALRNRINLNIIDESEYVNLPEATLDQVGLVSTRITSRAVMGEGLTTGVNLVLDKPDSAPADNSTGSCTRQGRDAAGNATWDCDGGNFDNYTLEVIDRMGTDSFQPDHGVMIAKTKNRDSNPFIWTIDANPQDIDTVDYVRPDGTPVMITRGDQRQLNDALFHAGTDSGSEYEYVDEANGLHFYITDVERDDQGLLSYDVAIRSLTSTSTQARGVALGQPVSSGSTESGLIGLTVPVTNTGAAGADALSDGDVYRVAAAIQGEAGGWRVQLPNALVALGTGATKDVPVHLVYEGDGAPTAVPAVTVTVTSESDPAATASTTTSLVDAVKPVATLVTPTTAGPFQALSIQVDATDNYALKRVVANIYQNGTLFKSTQTAANGASSATHVATVALPDGDYTVKYNAEDLTGNIAKTGTFAFSIDATAPTVTVKTGANETAGADGVYSLVSFKLFDAGKIDKLTLNGVVKDLTDNAWSDLNFVKPGAFGGVAGENTLVVYDVAGNATTLTFTLN
ncbi:hypothetical protein [Agromyces larvae]|uniref:M6 family metalloprotease domain-containing protein n=1 Tax=Agromyces larvae TaxID=2929802 RepID=A0ABY4C4D6_9MICO|nr:hypothetical protein [Agromyces larvae]UOE44936.1 hypothetical protein MTO99_03910 [Agromyces larvae]